MRSKQPDSITIGQNHDSSSLAAIIRPQNQIWNSSLMSLQSVRDFFSARQLDLPIIVLDISTATVSLAAEAHGVEPGRIAKTLAFRLNS
jgi:hypothetical protein